MRWLAVCLLAVTACTEHGRGGGGDGSRPAPPPECLGRLCLLDEPPAGDECCDSFFCYFDDEANQWQGVFCDPPLDPCEQCTPEQQCVQAFDGTCNSGTFCVDRVVACPDNACTPACEAAYCSPPTQCQNRVPCGTESPGAFTCYGP